MIPAVSTPPSSRLRIVRDEAAFLALAPHWDALLARSATRTPFLTWDWVSLWWRYLGRGCTLAMGVVDDAASGLPLAIAPFIIGKEPDGPRRHLRHLTFMGCIGGESSQGMDFIVPREHEAALVPLLCETFQRTRGDWDAIHLPTLHEESPHLPAMRAALAAFAASGERMGAQSCFLMALPTTWDEQVATWKSKERVIYRTKWKKMLEQHQGRALRGGTDLPWQQAFDELWRVHAMRFEGRHSLFINDRMKAFQRELIERWAPLGRIVLPLLELDGSIAAARYGFAYEGKYWSFQAGYDQQYANLSVGKLSLGWTTQCAIENGLREIDHLPGEESYKEQWSTHKRRVLHLEAFNPSSPRAALFRLLRRLKRNRAEALAASLASTVSTTAS